jgi:ABC-type transport system involved in cytochrome c biogenesis permease subunit
MKTFQRYLPWIAMVLSLVLAGQKVVRPDSIDSSFDLDALRAIPVSADGRTKPLDTVARNSLKMLSGKQSLRTDDGRMSATEWYVELVSRPDDAVQRRVFRIDHPDVLAMLGLDDEKRTQFSFAEIRPQGEEIQRQAFLADQTKSKARDPFQRAVLVLYQRLSLFSNLSQLQTPYLVAPLTTGEDWRSLAAALTENPKDPDALLVMHLLSDYGQKNSEGFNKNLKHYKHLLAEHIPYDTRKARYEVVFNQIQPFYTASVLYVLAFLFGCFGLLSSQFSKPGWSNSLRQTTMSVIAVAFLVHTVGIASRVYLQGRPPVTNLYSSAVFIGWISVLLGVMIDRRMSIGLGGIMAAIIGFATLIIAHNLGSSGDTMEMMQAVLDSNFWLATHVVVITIGYAAVFFAGFLGIAYVLLGLFTRTLDRERGKSLVQMTYGVICFAALTSFVGTVLGGIWADQSWGRFWGWDAKENGAALIVLWTLIILHARWGGMIRDRGIILLAIGGNIITAWSWFGTNMLGVGLHSYGFTQSAMFWLAMFILSQLFLIGIGLIPVRFWRSRFERPDKNEKTSETLASA